MCPGRKVRRRLSWMIFDVSNLQQGMVDDIVDCLNGNADSYRFQFSGVHSYSGVQLKLTINIAS